MCECKFVLKATESGCGVSFDLIPFIGADVVISTAGAMPGGARQEADLQQLAKQKNDLPDCVRWPDFDDPLGAEHNLLAERHCAYKCVQATSLRK